MTFTSSLMYIAACGGLLYLACSKRDNTAAIPVSAPVVEAPYRTSISRLYDELAATQNDPNSVPVDVRDIPASYVPIDHNRLNSVN